jgi:hypothetical protein
MYGLVLTFGLSKVGKPKDYFKSLVPGNAFVR